MNKKQIIVLIGIAISAFAIGFLSFLMMLNQEENKETVTTTQVTVEQEKEPFDIENNETPLPEDELVYEPTEIPPFATGTDKFGDYVVEREGQLPIYNNILEEGEEVKVNWYKGARFVKDSDAFMKAIDPDYIQNFEDLNFLIIPESENTVTLYEAGEIVSPSKLQGKLYYIFIQTPGMGIHYPMHIGLFDKEENAFWIINKISEYYNIPNFSWTKGLIPYEFTELQHKSVLKYEEHAFGYETSYEDGRLFSLEENAPAENKRGGIVDIIEGKVELKPENNIVFENDEYGKLYKDKYGYYQVLADGSSHYYDYIINIFDHERTPKEGTLDEFFNVKINWDDPANDDKRYVNGGELSSGCGPFVKPLTQIINDKEWFDSTKLVKIGTTEAGDPVYEMSDKATNSYYKDLFGIGYSAFVYFSSNDYNGEEREEFLEKHEAMSEEEKFAAFIETTPLFILQDPFGDYRVFISSKYQAMAECGKPVIYLYPEEQIVANVQVEPNGGFTVTDPIYPEGGWTVVAEPNGDLYYPKNGQNYPYLFWEGHADGFGFSEKGFVFAKEDVPSEMRELLYKTGLNYKETEDFMEFWEEKMIVKDYVFVTFVPQRDFDRAAPLKVTPAPETTIRVFMDFEPIDEYKKVEPLNIITPERKGYTVVEWGGVLRK